MLNVVHSIWVRVSIVVSLALFCGCATVRTDAEDSTTIAFWVLGSPKQFESVANVLRDHGLHATVDQHGVAVKADEQLPAIEVLLTDQRLKDSGLLLLSLVEAGTGRRTEEGMLARVLVSSVDGKTCPLPTDRRD